MAFDCEVWRKAPPTPTLFPPCLSSLSKARYHGRASTSMATNLSYPCGAMQERTSSHSVAECRPFTHPLSLYHLTPEAEYDIDIRRCNRLMSILGAWKMIGRHLVRRWLGILGSNSNSHWRGFQTAVGDVMPPDRQGACGLGIGIPRMRNEGSES
jgi:hypothetical protein